MSSLGKENFGAHGKDTPKSKKCKARGQLHHNESCILLQKSSRLKLLSAGVSLWQDYNYDPEICMWVYVAWLCNWNVCCDLSLPGTTQQWHSSSPLLVAPPLLVAAPGTPKPCQTPTFESCWEMGIKLTWVMSRSLKLIPVNTSMQKCRLHHNPSGTKAMWNCCAVACGKERCVVILQYIYYIISSPWRICPQWAAAQEQFSLPLVQWPQVMKDRRDVSQAKKKCQT